MDERSRTSAGLLPSDRARALHNEQNRERGQVMKRYRATIDLNSISYEIEAESEEQAIEYAEECFYEETLYDILKWANYTTEEQEEDK